MRGEQATDVSFGGDMGATDEEGIDDKLDWDDSTLLMDLSMYTGRSMSLGTEVN